MNSNNHQETPVDPNAEELEAFLTAHLNGQSLPIPTSLSTWEVELVMKLAAQAREIQPDPKFAADLAALLHQQTLTAAQDSSQSGPEQPAVPLEPTEAGAEVLSQSRKFPNQLQLQFLNTSQRGFNPMNLARRFRPSQQLSVAVGLLVILSVAIISTPSLSTFAREFFQAFQRTKSDQVGSQNNSGNAQSPALFKEKLEAAQKEFRTTATVREMETQRGFALKEPQYVPTDFVLKEVLSPFAEVVSLNYENPHSNTRLIVTQQRLNGEAPVVGPIALTPTKADGNEHRISILWAKEPLFDGEPALTRGSPVGASAKIESVQIGNTTGEYVEGAWEGIFSPNTSMEGMRWTQNSNFRQIQWREGNMLFQVVTPDALSKKELVAVANSMQ